MARIVLLPLLALALVNFVAGATGKKVELVKYPVPGSEDAVGEVRTKEARKVLDDFYRSKVLADVDKASVTNDGDIFARLLAEREVINNERFGRGEILTKAQNVADFRSGRQHMSTHTHDHVRLIAFGENTVVVTGHSTSALHHDGKASNGSRLLTEVWVKQGGQWRMVLHCMSDIEGLEDRSEQ